MPQGPRKQRLMRRDFAGANKRDDKWSEEKPRGKKNVYLETADYTNLDFEEYYKGQVLDAANLSLVVLMVASGCPWVTVTPLIVD